MMKKKLVSVYNFGTYFFPFTKVEASFSNLLTRANHNFIKPKGLQYIRIENPLHRQSEKACMVLQYETG